MSFGSTRAPIKPTAKAKWQVPKRKTGRGPMEYYMDTELKERFCRAFAVHSNRRIMLWFGLSFSTVQRFAREFGLKKDMRAIRKELASDVKKICEKNGYYGSIRGKAPSEACMEAVRRKRAEGFVPMLRLKETSPRKYKRVISKKAEARRELIRKERLRDLYGLERRTRLKVSRTLTRAASVQKCMMMKRRNYYADPGHHDWVCYDDETSRSPRMEATAIRHGLKVMDGGED